MTDAPLPPPHASRAPHAPHAILASPHDRPCALLSVAELREIEKSAEATLPAHTLMGRAGHAGARFLVEHIAHDGSADPHLPVWIVAGPGNNGGDALVVAAQLRREGVAVEVCMPVDVKPDDARWALSEARAAGVAISNAAPASFDGYGWLVDGMFGIGLTRPLEGIFASIAQQLSARARTRGRVLALDVPSGLDSDTGNVVEGGAAVRASHTVTFIGAKPGLFMASGRDLAGDVTVASIGVEASREPGARLNAPALFVPHFPPRDYATHKGTFGSIAVVGGDTGMCGAPILAARAALYAGAGKVHVAFLGTGSPPYDPPHPELMLHPLTTCPSPRWTRCLSVAVWASASARSRCYATCCRWMCRNCSMPTR